MLIKALCDYYDLLAKSGNVLEPGYSKVGVSYLVCLSPEGKIDEIIDWRKTDVTEVGKGKVKEKRVPREVIMPERTEKTGIDSNIIEHRPLYIFGLNYVDGEFTTKDSTGKAEKSNAAFAKANLDFIDGINSPVVNAYAAFINGWQPENETENPFLLELGKGYSGAGYAFCLSGAPDKLLHEDAQIKQKWEALLSERSSQDSERVVAQCAVSGENEPIARIHSKIKGVAGGLATGTVLVGFNNPSENSYGSSQSYNSNISESAAKKYTEALNYLLNGRKHKTMLDDITVVFWAMSDKKEYDDVISAMLFSNPDVMDAGETEMMLSRLVSDAKQANVSYSRISSLDGIDPNVDFYMLGLKPNSSRLAVKFIYHRKFGEILMNIAQHQSDMQISREFHCIALWQLNREFTSPKNKNETVDPAMLAKIFESVVYARPYPEALLSTVIRRVKTDTDIKISPVRAGIIKACINRKARQQNKKEELSLALDIENKAPAYLCGRLFAVLEKLQQDASNNSLNRTIKDSYFASASSKPAIVFPKLLRLAQNHLNKSKRPVFYNKLIGEIVDSLGSEFPEILLLTDQGKFIIGYYQQYQSFFVKKDSADINENMQEVE